MSRVYDRNDAKDPPRLETPILELAAESKPLWGSHHGASSVATMRYWVGRPLLELGDPVATAVGLRWVAAAWDEAGLHLGLDDCDNNLVVLAPELGPPDGDIDAWLQALLLAAAEQTLTHFERHHDTLLAPFDVAASMLGADVARCLDLAASSPARAALAFLRNRTGLSVTQAAQRCGLSASQWSHAESRAIRDPAPELIERAAAGFGITPSVVQSAVDRRQPLDVRRNALECRAHGSDPAPLELAYRPLWRVLAGDGRVGPLPVWLAPSTSIATCSAPTCTRSFALGGAGAYLLDLEILLGGSSKERPRTLARHLVG